MGQATSAVISYDTSGFSKGREVVPSVSNDRYQQQLRGKIYGAELEVRISGVWRDTDIKDPFWDALASGSFLTYQAAGKAPARLGLKGAGQAVRKFVADCEAIFRHNSTAANSPATKARARDAAVANAWALDTAAAIKRHAQQRQSGIWQNTGDRLGKIHSVASKTPVTVTLQTRRTAIALSCGSTSKACRSIMPGNHIRRPPT